MKIMMEETTFKNTKSYSFYFNLSDPNDSFWSKPKPIRKDQER